MTTIKGKKVLKQDYMTLYDAPPPNKPGQPVTDFKVEAEYKYTGQRQVKGIGLYYYNARFYDPEIGRFIREDSYDGELDNPQSQNIYIYVMNNPLKYVDPTGNYAEDSEENKNDFDIFKIFDAIKNITDILINGGISFVEEEKVVLKKNNLAIDKSEGSWESISETTMIDPDTGAIIDNPQLYFMNENLEIIDTDEMYDKLLSLTESEKFKTILQMLPKNEHIHVIGIGYGQGNTLGYWPVGGQGTGMILFDDKGNIGLYGSIEAGIYLGIGGSGGQRILVSNAENIYGIPSPAAGSIGLETGFGTTTVDVSLSFSTGDESLTFGSNTGAYLLGGPNFNLAYTFMYNPSWILASKNIGENQKIQEIFDVLQNAE